MKAAVPKLMLVQYHTGTNLYMGGTVACEAAVPKLTLPPQLLNRGHAARS